MLPRAIIPAGLAKPHREQAQAAGLGGGDGIRRDAMFMENGFRHAMLDSMVNVIERLDGQIVILNRTLYTLAVPYKFPYRRSDPGKGSSRQHCRCQPGLRGDPIGLLARYLRRIAQPDLRHRHPA